MVAFPVLETETTESNGEHPTADVRFDIGDQLTNEINKNAKESESRLPTILNESNYTVPYNEMENEKSKFSAPANNLNADHIIAKTVAVACLKGSSKNEKKKQMAAGSLSSGSSIVTISSVTNSEPDPEFPNGPDGSGNQRSSVLDERWYQTTLQVSVPFFIAGIGTIGAGLVLAEVQDWPVFKAISQLFILVPSLLGLKGNLDMCLASRLCTQAHLGNMTSFREIVKMIIGNIALVQVQAIIAACVVSVFATGVSAIMDGNFNWNHTLLLCVSSICTATSSCFILDFAMVAVIMLSFRCNMNPDNLATPLAASIGDVVSLSVLAAIASSLFLRLETEIWILYAILCGYALLLPFWVYVVLKNKYTRNILTNGWIPVFSALFISGFGGLILDQVVDKFKGFVIFQPIINGIGGNLVSVQASRISTILHQTTLMGILPPYSKMWVSPWTALFKGALYAKTARILIAMAVVGHLVFIFVADYIKWNKSTLHVYFVLAYLIVSVLQVMLLLYIAHIMIHGLWIYKIDPDNCAIPFLTALGDLTGSMFLALAFLFLENIHKEYGEY